MTLSSAALARQEITTFAELRLRAQPLGPKRVAIVAADDEVALTAADGALHLGIAIPVLIGNQQKIRAKAEALGLFGLVAGAEFISADDAATVAIRMAHDGHVDLLLKGHLRTDELLRAALDKQAGLRTGRLLSDVLLYEDKLAGETRLVGISDGGLNVLPNLEQKKQIVQNAIEVMRSVGLAAPEDRTDECHRSGQRFGALECRCPAAYRNGRSRRVR